MSDKEKPKGQLIEELQRLRQRVAELQTSEAEHKRAEAEIIQLNRELTTLNKVGQALISTLDLQETLTIVTDHTTRLLGVAAASVILHDEAKGDLWFAAASGKGADFMQSVRLALGEGIAGWVVQQGEPVMVPDVSEDPRWFGDFDKESGFTTGSILCVPLQTKGQTIGAIEVINKESGTFDQEDLRLLTSLAAPAATAIETARLHDQAQKEIAERKRAQEEIHRLSQFQESIIDNANIWLDVLDEKGNIVIWNKAAEEISGYSRQEVVGHGKIWEWLYPDEEYRNEVFAEAIATIEKGGEEQDSETTIRCKDGQTRVFSWNSRNLMDEKGNPIGSIALGHDITERKQAEAKLRRRAVQLQAAAEVSRATTSVLDPNELLRQTVDLVRERFDLYYVGLFLLDEKRRFAVLRAATGEAGRKMLEAGHKLEVGGESMIGWCIANAQARIALDVTSASSDFELSRVVESGKETVRFDNPLLPETRSEIALPLVARGQVIGAMSIQSAQAAAFSEEDITVFQTMADQLANAIENARLFDNTQQAAQRSQALYETSRALSSHLEEEPMMRAILEAIYRTLGCEHAAIAIVDEQAKTISDRHVIWRGEFDVFPEWIEKASYPLDHPDITADIARTGRTEIIEGWDERFNREIYDKFGHERLLRIFMPIKMRDRVIGVAEVGYDKRVKGSVGEEDVQLLAAFMDQAAVALERARMFRETQVRAEELAILNEIGRALTKMLDVDAVIESLYKYASRLLDTTNFYIALYHSEQNEVSFPFYAEGDQRRRPERRQARKGLTEYVIRTREPLLIEENVTTRLEELGIEMIGQEAQSWLGVPMMIGEQVIGVIATQSYTTLRLYNAHHRNLLVAIANQAANAIENARLFEELQQTSFLMGLRVKELACLNDIGRKIVETPPIPGFLQWVAARIPSAMQYQQMCLAAVEFQGQVYGAAEAVSLPRQMVQALRIEGEAVGRVYIAYTEDHDFLDEESALLGDIVRRVSGYIESRRLFEETQARAQELAVLNELGQALTARLGVEEVLEEAYRQAARLVDTTNFFIALYDPEKDEITFPYTMDSEENDWSPLKKGEGLTGRVVETGKPLLLPTGATGFHRETGGEIRYDEVGKPALSWLGVPLVIGDRVLGVMAVQSYTTPGLYDEHDQDLLMAIASPTAIAIQNARLFEDTKSRLAQLTALQETIRAVASTLELDKLLNLITQQATTLLQGDGGIINLVDWENREDEVVTASGSSSHAIGFRSPLEDSLSGWVTLHNQPVISNQLQDDNRADVYVRSGELQNQSAAIAPLTIKDQVIGTLVVMDKQGGKGEFDQADLDLLLAFANQAATAIQNARLFEETLRRTQELSVINEVGSAITSLLDVDAVLRQIVDTIKTRFGLYFVCILLVEGDQLVFRDGSTFGDSDARQERGGLRLDRQGPGLTVEATRTGQPVLVNDVLSDPRYVSAPETAAVRSELAVPIEVKGRVIGVLDVQSDQPHAFDQTNVALLQSLASQAGVTLENVHLFEETRTRAEELAVLNEMGRTLTTMLDVDAVIENLYRYASRLVDTSHFYVALYDPEQDMVSFPLYIEREQTQRIEQRRGGEGLTGYVIRTREPLLIEEDVAARIEELGIKAFSLEALSWLGVPMTIGGRVIGVISAHSHTTPRLYNEHHRDLLVAIANQAAIAIENARLFGQAQARAERERFIREISDQMQRATDMETLMRITAEELNKALDGSRTFVRLGAEAELIGGTES